MRQPTRYEGEIANLRSPAGRIRTGRWGALVLVLSIVGCGRASSSVTPLRAALGRLPPSCPMRMFRGQPAPPDALALVRLQAACPNDAFDECAGWLAARTCEMGGNILYDLQERFVTSGQGYTETTQLVITAIGGYSERVAARLAVSSGGDVERTAPGPVATCEPACRQGYDCLRGTCVSACNPPCAESERCSGHGADADCQPLASGPDAPAGGGTMSGTTPSGGGTITVSQDPHD